SLNNLALLYHNQGRYDEAEPLYQRSLAILEQALGPEHRHVASALNNLAGLSYDRGRYALAEPLYQRALAIYEQALGPEHPQVAVGLHNLALLYRAQGRYAEAEPLFGRALDNLARQFEQHFTYMSEKERLLFLDTVDGRFQFFFSFVFAYYEEAPELVGKMYDVVLWKKGFIAQSVAALRTQVAASGDPEALRLLDELTAKKTQLA
ncbi:tetratricopeptide repeat protein, partial [Acidobacteriia bacterium AH_259_A11_L15]|nr:tetratricopeptide repeat protein [Acidobacteriia bacterium AH_259_A11_L15]